jgi:hypothetical protein
MVMMIASTPSLKASSRLVLIDVLSTLEGLALTVISNKIPSSGGKGGTNLAMPHLYVMTLRK